MNRGILDTIARTRYGAIQNVNSDLVDWREVEGQKGNYIKVLALDTSRNRVDFLFRQDPHAEFAKHNHRCLAIAYTLGGLWGYREGEELHFPGTYSYEPPGSIHTPYSTADGMFLFGSFQGDSDVMLEILDKDDRIVDYLKLNFFAQYYDGK
jgi:hypothetical protein